MARENKRTVRLEIDIASDVNRPIVVNYRELLGKALGNGGNEAHNLSAETPAQQQHTITAMDGEPMLRRKNKCWDIADFRSLAYGYEEDSFIDDTEMYEESITESLKDAGFHVRSGADKSEEEYESDSNINSESTENATESVIKSALPTNTSFKKREELSYFLESIRYNSSLEIVPVERAGISESSAPATSNIPAGSSLIIANSSGTIAPTAGCNEFSSTPLSASSKSIPHSFTLFSTTLTPITSCARPTSSNQAEREDEESDAMSSGAETCCAPRGSPSPRPVITVDLCTSPEEDRRPSLSSVATANRSACPTERRSSNCRSVVATALSDSEVEEEEDDDDVFDQGANNRLAFNTQQNPETSSDTSPAARSCNNVNSEGGMRAHAARPVQSPQLSAAVALLDEVLASPAGTDKKLVPEGGDDVVARLSEACHRLPSHGRKFIYNKLAQYWSVTPKLVSRRFSRIRASVDKQPVKECVARLSSLLVQESKNENGTLSATIKELLRAAVRAESRCLERHPPRKGDLASALAEFARRNLLSLWAAGGPGAGEGQQRWTEAAAVLDAEMKCIASEAASAAASTAATARSKKKAADRNTIATLHGRGTAEP